MEKYLDIALEQGKKFLYGLSYQGIDLEKAYDQFFYAAENGMEEANFYLGLLSDWYNYSKSDYHTIEAYYKKAGDDPLAKAALGVFYYKTAQSYKETEEAKSILKQAIDAGCAEAYLGMAHIAMDNELYNTVYYYSRKILELGSEQAFVAAAMVNIGQLYGQGWGVEKNFKEEFYYYYEAAKMGNSLAMYKIANMYEAKIVNNEKDENSWFDVKWWIDKEDWYDIEIHHHSGEVNADSPAVKWYKKSARLGETEAMYKLGIIYRDGSGTKQSYVKALKWLNKAAEQNSKEAMYTLACMYKEGEGVAQDNEKALKWLNKAAEQEHVRAMYELGGLLYHNGIAVDQDKKMALKYFEKVAENDVILGAHVRLEIESIITEVMDKYREGTGEDFKNALDTLDEIMEDGYEESMSLIKEIAIELGNMYRYGTRGVMRDYNKALRWYKANLDHGKSDSVSLILDLYEDVAKHGDTDVIAGFEDIMNEEHIVLAIGDRYYRGVGIEQDYDKAFQSYEKAAEKGDDSKAMRMLGNMFRKGQGVPQDCKNAFYWYRKAALLGDWSSSLILGDMYREGKGVTQDLKMALECYKEVAVRRNDKHIRAKVQDIVCRIKEKDRERLFENQGDSIALEYYKLAAEINNTDAMAQIGKMYYDGWTVTQNYYQASYYLEIAAELGNVEAMHLMGEVYFWGRGKKEDYTMSFIFYKASAKLGNVSSMISIGNMYLHGIGMPKSRSKAFEWYDKAAKLGDKHAMELVADMYRRGDGVEKNIDESIKWRNRAELY